MRSCLDSHGGRLGRRQPLRDAAQPVSKYRSGQRGRSIGRQPGVRSFIAAAYQPVISTTVIPGYRLFILASAATLLVKSVRYRIAITGPHPTNAVSRYARSPDSFAVMLGYGPVLVPARNAVTTTSNW